ncbi:uncharacterized protein LOC108092329 [Drosophila ficusphila]|uniref:uncharacterized protein LOC108092329 n=1 Tax=Drosophila ficusphila TaxID=30025 RepID=UPI0007E7B323|nr:uncharacterized protein LOC108092329 [Drosophila ficusphila]
MDMNKSTLLPYVMDLLSRQPQLCTTKEDLIKSIRDIVLEEHIAPFGSLKRAVDAALEVGVNLGILSLTDERVPFNFRRKKPQVKAPAGTWISPRVGRMAIKQRIPKYQAKKTAAKLKLKRKKHAGRTVAGQKIKEKVPGRKTSKAVSVKIR